VAQDRQQASGSNSQTEWCCADPGSAENSLMLADLQSFIANIYDADCGHRLHDFLITDRALAREN
jgi:hypothetical protein